MVRIRLTDFTGVVEMTCVWKLNGLAAGGAPEPSPSTSVSSDMAKDVGSCSNCD